jgi:hypothetical protein
MERIRYVCREAITATEIERKIIMADIMPSPKEINCKFSSHC